MSVSVKTSVPLEPFQTRFRQMEAGVPQRNGVQPKDAGTVIARRLGWYTPNGGADSPRVRRTLGLRPGMTSTGRVITRKRVGYDMALRLCDAMDIDPVDVGL